MRSAAIWWSLAAFASLVSAQRCSGKYGDCPDDLCCSQYGWCGSSDAYCGKGCQDLHGLCGSSSPGRTKPSNNHGNKGNNPSKGHGQPEHGNHDEHPHPHSEPPRPSPSKHTSKPGTLTHKSTASTKKTSIQKTSTHKTSIKSSTKKSTKTYTHKSSSLSTSTISSTLSTVLSSSTGSSTASVTSSSTFSTETSSTASFTEPSSSSTEISSTASSTESSSSSTDISLTASSTELSSSSTEASSTTSAIPSASCVTVVDVAPIPGSVNFPGCTYTPPDAPLGFEEALVASADDFVPACKQFCVNTPGCQTIIYRVSVFNLIVRCTLYGSVFDPANVSCDGVPDSVNTAYGATCAVPAAVSSTSSAPSIESSTTSSAPVASSTSAPPAGCPISDPNANILTLATVLTCYYMPPANTLVDSADVLSIEDRTSACQQFCYITDGCLVASLVTVNLSGQPISQATCYAYSTPYDASYVDCRGDPDVVHVSTTIYGPSCAT